MSAELLLERVVSFLVAREHRSERRQIVTAPFIAGQLGVSLPEMVSALENVPDYGEGVGESGLRRRTWVLDGVPLFVYFLNPT